MSRYTSILIPFLTLTFAITFVAPLVHADASDPHAQSPILPSPGESGMPEKIARKEVRRIRREFTELLDHERDTLRADQTRKKREGDASRKIRKREWDAQEKNSRRKFFEAAHRGPDKRDYMRALIARRIAFYDQLKTEERQERSELAARWDALRESQRTRLISVEEFLKRSERPPSHLLERAE